MAKAFRFSLETVRRLRKQTCDRQMREVAKAVGDVHSAESAQSLLDRTLSESLQATKAAQGQRVLDIAAIRTGCAHQGWLATKLESMAVEVEQRRARLAAERRKLGDASAQLKAIEKLRERQWRRHLAQLDRAEQAAGDEVASRVCCRPSRGPVRVRGTSGAA